ncbi:MAG: hypothetical protein JWN44_7249 [Myxococcales bacterium]|nr:hypothetical protein [Myxococcales bacterium]
MDDETKQERTKRVVYSIIEKPGLKKAIWMKIGVAWLNRDQSWNVHLDAIPFDRKLNIREETERPSRYGNNEASVPLQTPFDLGETIQ